MTPLNLLKITWTNSSYHGSFVIKDNVCFPDNFLVINNYNFPQSSKWLYTHCVADSVQIHSQAALYVNSVCNLAVVASYEDACTPLNTEIKSKSTYKVLAMYCNVLQCIAIYYSVLQCIAMYRSVLQCITVYSERNYTLGTAALKRNLSQTSWCCNG